MVEKEEIMQNNRIINAEKYKRRIKKGRIYIDVRDKKLNCLLSKVYTRQEAIEKMAKALIDIALTGHYSRFEDSCVVEDAIPYAKAALNALLGE